jgi:trehalose-6-phosphate synthase
MYRKINERFADVVIEEVGTRKAFVFVQDYHLTLLPRLLRDANPNLIVAQFWHIPWPNPEAFRICPWQKEILEGLRKTRQNAVFLPGFRFLFPYTKEFPVMVSRLNQFPPSFPFLTKEVLQPFETSRKNIVDKTEAILITFDRR